MGSCFGHRWRVLRLIMYIMVYLLVVASSTYGEKVTIKEVQYSNGTSHSSYKHVWPELRFGWRIVVGTIIGFLGAAFGSVGGVGGGGIFVPMLTLILGFDTKSSAAVSKCMITGTAVATVYYNLGLRHPDLDMPLIDYDLALLFQPMLVLGVSIGVAFNVIFADWMITVLLLVLFAVTSSKAFSKGVKAWKKETITKKEAARVLESNDSTDSKEVALQIKKPMKKKVSVIENVQWKELGLLVAVWVSVLALQIAKNYTTACSATYWLLNLFQIPVAVGVSAFQSVSLYKGKRVIPSKGDSGANWRLGKLISYCALGIVSGIVAGLLGLGGGFILGPLFLEMGIPPQVAAATATFAMTFSSSMSVVEYYLLKRFPVPYSLYLVGVSTIAALSGQHVVSKIIKILGRASIIIFVLASLIFVSALFLGGVSIVDMVEAIKHKEYMGFEDICAIGSQ